MIPASKAVRPASTASLNARAMATGSPARAIAVLTSTASAPISIASAACEGEPRPASTTSGTSACSIMIRIVSRSLSPRPLPIGAASGMTVAQPTSSSFFWSTGSGQHVRQHREAVLDELGGRAERLDGIGQQVARVGDHLELHPVREPARPREAGRADGLLGRLAAGGVRQQQDVLREERGDVVAAARRGRCGERRP